MADVDKDFVRRQRLTYYDKLFVPAETVIQKPAEEPKVKLEVPQPAIGDTPPLEPVYEYPWESDYGYWEPAPAFDWEGSVKDEPEDDYDDHEDQDSSTRPSTLQFSVTFTPRVKPALAKVEDFLPSTSGVETIHDCSCSSEQTSLHDSIKYARKRPLEESDSDSPLKRRNNDSSPDNEPPQSLTVETLTTLHSALKSCPTEQTLETDPRGLRVKLMPHQKHALAWLLWREKEKPSGGILADDMGLGKTLTMISLVMRSREIEYLKESSFTGQNEEDENDNPSEWANARKMISGGTLVVCPASVVRQWEKEIKDRCKDGLLSVLLYHGPTREVRAKRIARKDIVISTYNLVGRESGIETSKKPVYGFKDKGPLHRIRWKRIILDEAHIVRNHKSLTSMGVNALVGKYRWCLTGTPIQNKELDLYALLKFLRCSPFDDLKVWKRWVDNKNEAGLKRLSAMMKSLMLRRTKQQLQEKGELENLTSKSFVTIPVTLDSEELKIYQKVALFSSTLFMQFLRQRADKEQLPEARTTWEQGDRSNNQWMENEEVLEMYRKMKLKNTEIKSHHILVLLLRLRQICCHAGLIKQMLLQEDLSAVGLDDEEESLDDDLFTAMEKFASVAVKAEEGDMAVTVKAEKGDATVTVKAENGADSVKKEPGLLDEDDMGTSALSPDNPILEFSRASSKVRAVLDMLLGKVMATEDDKAVVVSQWTSMLTIVHDHLRDMGVACEVFCGNVPLVKRMEIVEDFNSKDSSFRVLLLSLTAGGVGLNLIGGNHLFLMDLHWNPQWEAQACDRIFRVGQSKPVFIYKFICADTIEERIRELQEKKLALANDVLTGTINLQAAKLSIQDLKLLFGIGSHQPDTGIGMRHSATGIGMRHSATGIGMRQPATGIGMRQPEF